MKLREVDLSDFIMLDGNPMPAPRPRLSNGRAHNKPTYTALKAAWAMQARTEINQRGLPTYFNSQRLRVIAVFFRSGGGDGDNMAKTVTDSLNGVWYEDDRQIDAWQFYVVRQTPSKEAYALVWVDELPADSVIDKLRQWWRDRRER